MWDAIKLLLSADLSLHGLVVDTARLDKDGGLVRDNYLILGRAGPADLDDDRYGTIPLPDSEADYVLPLKAVAADPSGVEMIADRVRSTLVGKRPLVPGRRCDPLTVEFSAVKTDTSIVPPLFFMDMWAVTTSRRG